MARTLGLRMTLQFARSGIVNDLCTRPTKKSIMSDKIEEFLGSKIFAVVGASKDPTKYGYKVFVALKSSGREVFPLNPNASEIDGAKVFADLASLPQVPDALSLVTPPSVTRQVVQQAIALGVKILWMQPGAEDAQASHAARDAGLTVIDDGSCVLVALALESGRIKRG